MFTSIMNQFFLSFLVPVVVELGVEGMFLPMFLTIDVQLLILCCCSVLSRSRVYLEFFALAGLSAFWLHLRLDHGSIEGQGW